MSILRRARGVIGTAIYWGAAYVGVSAIWMLAARLFGNLPDRLFTIPVFVQVARLNFLMGAATGIVFAVFVLLRARKLRVTDLPTGTLAIGAFLGAALVPIVASFAFPGRIMFGSTIAMIVTTLGIGTIGASIAFSSIRIARRVTQKELAASLTELQIVAPQ